MKNRMQNNIAVNHGFYLDMILKFEPLLKKSLLSFEETVDPPIVELHFRFTTVPFKPLTDNR